MINANSEDDTREIEAIAASKIDKTVPISLMFSTNSALTPDADANSEARRRPAAESPPPKRPNFRSDAPFCRTTPGWIRVAPM